MTEALQNLAAARTLAIKAHSGQTDKLGRPYIDHVTDVAQRVAHLGAEVEIIAWLHDIVEDTEITLKGITDQFNHEISEAVEAMTRRSGEDYFSNYLPRLMRNKTALQVKIADLRHNQEKLSSLAAVDPDTAIRLEDKYHKAEAMLLK